MYDSRLRSIDKLFGDTTDTNRVFLAQIQQRAVILLKLNRAISTLLPEPLRPWCRVANFRQGIIVLETANASWKMRLYYEQTQLLSELRAQILPSLSSIDIRINPDLARNEDLNAQNNDNRQQSRWSVGKKLRSLSKQSAESISHVAACSEGKLKNVLEQLAVLAGDSVNFTCRRK